MNTTLNPAHRLLLSTKPFQFLKTNHPNPQANTNPPPFPSTPLLHLTLRPPTHSNSLFGRVNSLLPRSHSSSSSPSQPQFVLEILVLFAFSLALLCLRLFSAVLLPEFPRRWQGLVAFAPEAEARTSAYPPHVWQAVVAYEDRRFFRHFGIDPVGIARAVVSFSALGGGSTITQQWVERDMLRERERERESQRHLNKTNLCQTLYLFLLFIPSNPCMGSFLFIPTVFLPFLLFILVSGGSFSEFIYPDFSASHFHFIDNAGAFLSSRNGTFKAAIVNPDANQLNFYLCIIHTASNTIIWTANRDASISASAEMNLTAKGISISDDDGNPVWSTPQFKSSVSALLLNEMGNLILLDQLNRSLWESFQNATDTIVNGQHLPVGSFLSSTLSNFSTGDYRLVLSGSDAILQWHGQTYWKLSMDTSAYTNSNTIVEYMAINGRGLQLLGRNGTVVVIQVLLSPSEFRIAKLDSSGKFIVQSFSGTDWKQEFVGPAGDCQIPSVCGRLGLCTASTTHSCSCPANFLVGSQDTGGCVPSGSYSLPVPCNSTDNSSQLNSPAVSYFRLDYGTDYFSNIFSDPVRYGVNLSTCQDLCSKDCSCLGIFYGNSSGSCYTLKDDLGSIFVSESAQNDLLGYIKALVGSSPSNFSDNKNPSRKKFPVVALVLLPFSGFFLLVALGFLLWGRRGQSKKRDPKLGHFGGSGGGQSSSSSVSLLVYFPLFALEMHEQGRYLELVDLRLEGRVTSEEVEKFVRVALCCVQEDPTLRPSMNTVVGMLEGGIPLGQPNLESLNFLRFIGRGFTEASMMDEGTDQNDRVLYPEAYASTATMGSRTFFSYVSSQQLVKNTFLKNERTFSRKLVEMVLSLALERTMSKGEILSCYTSKIYWGHGIYGVESASAFYFGKHPSCLSLGESSMLAGLIPAPELRSPLRDPSRGKTFQARVLKRMVDVGYLDIETALSVMKQYLPLQVNESEAPIVLPPGGGRNSKFKDIWDWEIESKILEACEDMDRWAINVLHTTSPNSLVHPITGCDL
ncbi:unnamed protein product [Malus baccata var. baccata]